ncbi:50S ribosomal protein L29 [Flammeovirgaceae bacterium 311]|nr:50S ribosomal protein L29 [Flammeovirgaceae bacterium 311]
MKKEDIRSLSHEELKERLAAERESLTKLKFAHEISPIENPTKIRHSRRLIARIETELRAKETNN